MKANGTGKGFDKKFGVWGSFIQVTAGAAFIVLALATLGVSAASAQETWQVDPQDSVARLSLGAGANALEVGLACVSGEVVLKATNPADSAVDLKINTGNPDQPQISFTSQQVAERADGKLAVTGDLTVTRAERTVTADANEAYAGPQYGDPVERTETHQVTLVFAEPSPQKTQEGEMELLGKTFVVREDFPELVSAVSDDQWPTTLINNETCEAPSTVGEDYSGVKCTGTEVASVRNVAVVTGSPSGEGFFGFKPVATPNQNHATIALDLKLKPASSEHAVSGAAGGGN